MKAKFMKLFLFCLLNHCGLFKLNSHETGEFLLTTIDLITLILALIMNTLVKKVFPD